MFPYHWIHLCDWNFIDSTPSSTRFKREECRKVTFFPNSITPSGYYTFCIPRVAHEI
jgi:hypothetical protein